MRKIVFGFCALTVATWLLNLGFNPPAMNGRSLTHEVFFLNGVLAWGLMAMAIVIAARPAWLEKVTATPLDELYKWHRTLGIWAAMLTLFHFFTKDVMRPVLSLFTLEPVPKIVRGELTGFDAFWAWMRGFAVESSEWATLLGLVLFVVSFISIVRYHKWLSSHKLFSVLFLILAVHCIRLTEAEDFLTPFGLINVAVTVIGCYYSLELLIRGAGREKSVSAEIVDVNTNNRLTLITVKPEKPVDIRYGEFAFLGTSGHEKHPFSVAGINDDGTLTFAVKALGDYTRDVVPMLQKGERVIVEGPWGRFRPDFSAQKQLWLAGGVGIAPFCAWMQDAAKTAHGKIRLVWCIKSKESEPMFANVEKMAERAGIRLEVFESAKKRLNAESLFAGAVPDTVALCAGEGLASAVSRAYVEAGGNADRVRKEHFNWR